MSLNKRQKYIENLFLSLILTFILILSSTRSSFARATNLRITVGGRFDNSRGTIAHHVPQSVSLLLPAASSSSSKPDPTPAFANIMITAKEIHNSGIIAAPQGGITMNAQKEIQQHGAAVARDAVYIETLGHLSFGSGSMTGVRGKQQSLDERPAVYVVAASVSGHGSIVGDLNPEPERHSQIKTTTANIDLSPQTVMNTHIKRLWNGRKKKRQTVEQIPFIFRGPVQLSGPQDIILTSVYFNAQLHQVSSVHAHQKIVLQGAKGSIYTAKSRLFGRASIFQEYLVPSRIDHALNIRSDHNNIILYGCVPNLQLTLEAPEGKIHWSAVPIHARIRSTGFGVSVDISALAGTLQSSTDLTPLILGERRLPKVTASFSLPLQSYIQQLTDSEQPVWAKILNTHGAYIDAHALLKDTPQWHESLTAIKVGGRLSYTSSRMAFTDYAASHPPPLRFLKMIGKHIQLDAMRIEAKEVNITAQSLTLNPAPAHAYHTVTTHSLATGVSIGVTSPLYVSVSTSHSNQYQIRWIPSEMIADYLSLQVKALNVIHSHVFGVQGEIHYDNLQLSEKQNRFGNRFYKATVSSSGAIQISLGHEDRKASSYRASIELLAHGLTIQSTPLPEAGRRHAVSLDLRPGDLFHDLKPSAKKHSHPMYIEPWHPKTSTQSMKKEPSSKSMGQSVQFIAQHQPAPQNYRDAITKGVSTGLHHLLEVIKHPIDQFLYPVSILTYDAIVCLTISEAEDADRVFPARPVAIARMKERWTGLKYAVVHFQKANSLQKTEQASAFLTTLVAPGQTIKVLSRLNRIAGDLHRFRVINPQQFQTQQWWDVAAVPPKVTPVTASEIQTISEATDLLYIVRTDGKLLLANEWLTESILTREGVKSRILCHPELAEFKPVVAAGIVKVKDDLIIEVNDASGHFKPHGDHLPDLVERVFERHDLPIKGKYQSRFGTPHPGLDFTRVAEPRLPKKAFDKNLVSGLPFFISKPNDADNTQSEAPIKGPG